MANFDSNEVLKIPPFFQHHLSFPNLILKSDSMLHPQTQNPLIFQDWIQLMWWQDVFRARLINDLTRLLSRLAVNGSTS